MTPLGRHLGEHRQQRLVAVARDVIVNLFGVDVAGILEHHAHLAVEVLIQIALQFGNRLTAQLRDDLFRVRRVCRTVEHFLGIDAHQRPVRAGTHAAGAAHQHLLARLLNRLHQRIFQLVGALAGAGQVHAHVHLVVVLRVFLLNALAQSVRALRSSFHGPPFQLLDHLLGAHFAHALRRRTALTGARLQAPTQRATIRLTSPSLVVWPWRYAQLLFSGGNQLVGALDVAGGSGADGNSMSCPAASG